ncbi:hypothetical protein [Flavobacterium rhizosphaerae]|uniref:Secreted protein n=1 Tax=Flavobacterium rhizosphaerae TaxID=3163298 RepID=A0ABW8YT09_9FLAO
MKKVFILLFIFIGFSAAAQGDGPKGGIAIPKTPDTQIEPSNTMVSPDSPFKLEPEKKQDYNYPVFRVGEKKSEFSMYDDSDKFVNRTEEYADRTKVSPKGESNEAYRGNQFFGEVRTDAKYVQVMARDFEYVDGDRIKVLVNGRIVVPEIILDSSFKGVQITLDEGFNKIDFEALNQGTSGPNTAEFRVFDDKENVISSNQWNLATGFKATVIVVKEAKQ